MRLFFSLIILLFLSSSAWATNWYLRDGGGTVYGTSQATNTCNGLTNAVYSFGASPNCALTDLSWMLGSIDYSTTNTTALMQSGDTLYIDGDSDTSPGAQAVYISGWGMLNGGYYCNGGVSPNKTDCMLVNLPAGTSGHPTQIIGTGTHRPQIKNVYNQYYTLSATGNYINLQWLEIVAPFSCGKQNPVSSCGDTDGLLIAGDQINLTDVYVHGHSRYGINTGQMGSATFTRVWVIGNAYGGITVGNDGSSSVTGTLTFNQPIVEWNGCLESNYPLNGIDNPSNYSSCYGSGENGYGDGLAFGSTGNQNAGNWTVIGPGSISFNTQDGFDVLHGNGNGTIQIDKMRFEGNAGNQVKANSLNFYFTNNIDFGDCNWWITATQSSSGLKANNGTDVCRADGNPLIFNVTNNSVANIYNNTIVSMASTTMEDKDINSTGCNGSTQINMENNIFYGLWNWDQDNGANPACGGGCAGTKTLYYYNDGNDGNGSGTCGTLVANEDYNVVGFTSSLCVGAHDKCNTSPGFTGSIGVGNGSAASYYSGTSGVTLVPLASNSAAKGAGVAGLTYWNTINDYYNNARPTPSIGGLEYNSTAANGYLCFFNSDCTSGTCTSNVCAGSGGNSNTGQWNGKMVGALQ